MNPRVLSFNYVLKNPEGQILDASIKGEPMAFLEGAGQIIPALETVLSLMDLGDKRNVKIEAKEGYGEYNPKMIMDVPREEVAHIELEVGSFLRLDLGDRAQIVRVTAMNDKTVSLDGNHPLAGVDLEFDVELVGKRNATDEEVAHGHAHGAGGHHH